MKRREVWQSVLEGEVRIWSARSYDSLIDALRELQTYTVERDSQTYQVEVQLLRKTDTFVQVFVSVDDGSLPASLIPAGTTFVVERLAKV